MSSHFAKQLAHFMKVVASKDESDADEALSSALETIASEAEDDKFSENNPDRLKVLVDPDAQKLVMKLYQQYISEDDYSTLVMFIKDFDNFLGKYRDRPLTKQEIEKIEQSQEEGADDTELPTKKSRKRKSKDKEVPIDDDVVSEDDGESLENPDEDESIDDVDVDSLDTDEDLEDEPSLTVSNTSAVDRIRKFISVNKRR